MLFAAGTAGACGSGDPSTTDAGAGDSDMATDGATDALDAAADGSDAAVDAGADIGVDTVEDGSDDAVDDTADAADTTDASVDAGREQGTVPLSDFVACDTNSDCPTEAGNCIQAVNFNRAPAGAASSVSILDLDPDWPAAGVCSRVCSDQLEACDELRLPGAPNAAYTCQVVATGDAPYVAVDGGFADPGALDPAQQTLGQPFAALCVPPFRVTASYPPDFCEMCDADLACEPGSACWLDTPFADDPGDVGSCLVPCDDGACPMGFACEALDAARGNVLGTALGDDLPAGDFCVPVVATCGACRDADGDGFGTGLCDAPHDAATPHDCDDSAPTRWFDADDMDHEFPGVCGADQDTNCNGIGDDIDQIGTAAFGAFHCTACGDTCSGGVPAGDETASWMCLSGPSGPSCGIQCDAPEAFADCDGVPENGCEQPVDDPSLLVYPDCDSDGVGVEVAPTFDCTGDGVTFEIEGETCDGVRAVTFDDAVTFDCNDSEAAEQPGGTEVCDGFDNDCNGTVDDVAGLGDLCGDTLGAGTLGICRSEARTVCDGSSFICQAGVPSAETCDGIDNDCDGTADEDESGGPLSFGGCALADGELPAVLGECRRGQSECSDGAPSCVRNTPTDDQPGDGLDTNCDGWDGDLSAAIFVDSVHGADTPSGLCVGVPQGTRACPYLTLDRALSVAETGAQLYLAGGATPYVVQSGPLPPSHGITLAGGYAHEAGSAVWMPTTSKSTVTFANLCGGSCVAGRTYRALATSGSPRHFVQIEFRVERLAAGHAVGLYCTQCEGVTLQDVDLVLAAGAPGALGEDRGALEGATGGDGATSTGTSLAPTPFGTSSCGRPGGYGGPPLSPNTAPGGVVVYPGFPGGPGTVVDGGGGAGGAPSSVTLVPGGTGGDGAVGADVMSGGAGGLLQSVPTFVWNGGDGVTGSHGHGGGGGGGAPSMDFGPHSGADIVGHGGGGGGGGGCGGPGGGGGGGGGSVIGLHMEGTHAPNVIGVLDVRVGAGGDGGDGGAGGTGGAGGAGGDARSKPAGSANLHAGAGGHGGGGAAGGGGGGGGGGWSLCTYAPIAMVRPASILCTNGDGGEGGLGGAGGVNVALDAFTGPNGDRGIDGEPGGTGERGVLVY